jgi:3-hydroxy-9,10-secoandrosta-1,3,5(10)-triene-9,17-dione monooxygenase
MTDNAAPLLAAAEALIPVLRDRATRADHDRAIPPETVADFHRLGFYRVLQPRRFGGLQLSFDVFSRIGETLALGCGASAWIHTVLSEHQWIIGCMEERAQIDIWGDDPATLVSSSLAPRETARPVDGGWRLSGVFPFSSGCLHARWAIIGARAEDAAGNLPTRYMLVPMTEIEIVDDWHVLGLRGTASRSLLVRDAFIPAYRTIALQTLMTGDTPGARVHPDYPLLRAPRGYLVPFSLPVVAFGLARRALEMTPSMLRARLSRGTRNLADSEVVQMALGEASAMIDLAILTLWTRRTESLARVAAREAITPAEVARNRRDIAFAADQLRRGVENLVETCGARVVYDREPLQTILRDIVTITTHTVVHRQMSMVPYGRSLLGLPIEG